MWDTVSRAHTAGRRRRLTVLEQMLALMRAMSSLSGLLRMASVMVLQAARLTQMPGRCQPSLHVLASPRPAPADTAGTRTGSVNSTAAVANGSLPALHIMQIGQQ